MDTPQFDFFPAKARGTWLVIALVLLSLTALLVAGIKIFIGGGDPQKDMPPSKALSDFKFQAKNKKGSPGYKPMRPATEEGVSSLDMFTKANAGYNAPPPAPAPVREAPPAVTVSAPPIAAPAPKVRPATVIPKMQAVPAFGSNIKNNPQGVTMPDISNLMRQATQQQTQQSAR